MFLFYRRCMFAKVFMVCQSFRFICFFLQCFCASDLFLFSFVFVLWQRDRDQ